MRRLAVVVAVLAAGIVMAPTAQAESLQIQPLQRQDELKKAESKKGFIDITNPTGESVTVKLYVNAFSQIDDKGNLQFFDNEQVRQGVKLDFETSTIGPRQTLRLYFLLEGDKLPTGDVFAVIFAETTPLRALGTSPAVRVGSLLMITNQTPGARHTEISRLSVPLLQIGSTVEGVVSVKNPAPVKSSTGFFPSIKINIGPWGGQVESKGPLIFAGRTRSVDFSVPSNQFGIYAVTVRANDASVTTYTFLITGWWRILAPLLLVGIVIIVLALLRRRRHHSRLRFR